MSTAWAAKYIGVPYLPGGGTMQGADCWGLVKLVLEAECGIRVADYGGIRYRTPADRRQVALEAREYATGFDRVPMGQERAFDGVLLREAGLPIHVGVVVERGLILHVSSRTDAVIEPYPSMLFNGTDRILGFYRPQGEQVGVAART